MAFVMIPVRGIIMINKPILIKGLSIANFFLACVTFHENFYDLTGAVALGGGTAIGDDEETV